MRTTVHLNAEQLGCLTSPVRNEAFVTLRSLGEASVAEIAEAMSRSPEALHYHVRSLLKAGLIREKARRPTTRKPEAVYESVATDFRLPDLRSHPELASLTRRSVIAGLRQTIRGYRAAAERAEHEPRFRERLRVVRATLRLSPEDAQQFLAIIEQAVEFAKGREDPDGERLYWCSVVFPDARR